MTREYKTTWRGDELRIKVKPWNDDAKGKAMLDVVAAIKDAKCGEYFIWTFDDCYDLRKLENQEGLQKWLEDNINYGCSCGGWSSLTELNKELKNMKDYESFGCFNEF